MINFTYKRRSVWQEIKQDLKITTPFAIATFILSFFIPLTFLAFMGLCVVPALIIKTIIRFKRGDYK